MVTSRRPVFFQEDFTLSKKSFEKQKKKKKPVLFR